MCVVEVGPCAPPDTVCATCKAISTTTAATAAELHHNPPDAATVSAPLLRPAARLLVVCLLWRCSVSFVEEPFGFGGRVATRGPESPFGFLDVLVARLELGVLQFVPGVPQAQLVQRLEEPDEPRDILVSHIFPPFGYSTSQIIRPPFPVERCITQNLHRGAPPK